MIIIVLGFLVFLAIVNGHFIIAGNLNRDISSFCDAISENLTYHDHTQFSYRIKEPTLCRNSVFMLNYVQSSSNHFDQRMIIRETFGSLKYIDGDAVKLLFVVGLPSDKSIQTLIDNESGYYRDIVQANFVDTYINLTLKHIVALHWIQNYCPQAQFIVKSDDDTFVNNFLLHQYLKEYVASRDKFILGRIFAREAPIRSPGNKWTVDIEMYKYDLYPPFMKGFGYVISQGAIEPLLICAYYHRYFYIDDIFITGLVARSAGIKLVDIDRTHSSVYFQNEAVKINVINSVFLVGNNNFCPKIWKDMWKKVLLLAS